MNYELLTKTDLLLLKNEILQEIKNILSEKDYENEWLKTEDVKKILQCSQSTLQNLRIQGKLKFSKVNGTLYYNRKDVMKLFGNTGNDW